MVRSLTDLNFSSTNQQRTLLYRRQAQTAELRGTSQKLYETRDELRVEKSIRFDTNLELEASRVRVSRLETSMGAADERQHELTDLVALLQSQLAEALSGKAAAEDQASSHLSALQSLEPVIKETVHQRDQLQVSLSAVEAAVPPLHTRITELDAALQKAEWVGKELSRALASVMPSLQANQMARRCLQSAVKKERGEIEVQSRVVEELRRSVRVMEGQMGEMAEEVKHKEDEVQAMTRVTRENMKAMEEARFVAEEKTEAAALLASSMGVMKRENQRLADEVKASSSALKATEDLQRADKDEVMRLFGSLQGLEMEVQHASEERMELVRKLERHQQQSKLLEEKVRRLKTAFKI